VNKKEIKTIFKKDNFLNFNTCHAVQLSNGYIKSTNNAIINGPFNHNIDFDVIQLNHYKSKTLPEYRYIRTRQRADIIREITDVEDVDATFIVWDINEIEDLYAYNFYKKIDI
jgi:hypothetical protein